MKKFKTAKWLIGIDEVGRGPLAGPVSVCACAMRVDTRMDIRAGAGGQGQVGHKEIYKNFLKKYEREIKSRELPGLNGRDSKKLKEFEREAWYEFLRDKSTSILFFYGTKSAEHIDKNGIAVCIHKLIEENLNKFLKEVSKESEENIKPEEVLVLLDGSLRAPKHFINQQTIIKGDEKELVISLASIYAKVTRDNYMKKISKKSKYNMYGLDKHKGYGTAKHLLNIKKYGVNDIHRKSFLKKVLNIL